jgi:hypothetical protein
MKPTENYCKEEKEEKARKSIIDGINLIKIY